MGQSAIMFANWSEQENLGKISFGRNPIAYFQSVFSWFEHRNRSSFMADRSCERRPNDAMPSSFSREQIESSIFIYILLQVFSYFTSFVAVWQGLSDHYAQSGNDAYHHIHILRRASSASPSSDWITSTRTLSSLIATVVCWFEFRDDAVMWKKCSKS